ncbi:transmembrane protein 104 homolog [Macrosteles quadrilineatus]|uniref:transmembrane protein 104 homolog n=1 Tax=Macrosteles quadrilineatus TaxID=74068 RepID=UPI0023E1EE98|nr:transmembrane protein 104 homolog [Macrosteles quadrilineatus]
MSETYSSLTGLVYIFNLIVGTGALTLPAAFYRSGWALGSILMCILSFVSYVTATFVVEAMATSNALLNFSKAKQLRRIGHYLDMAHQISGYTTESEEESYRSPSEESPLTAPGSIQNFPSDPVAFYTIDNKVEMGEMAALLFNRGGRLAFFLCFVSYLFGDLSIYAAAIGQSLVDTYCKSTNFTDPDDKPCLPNHSYSTIEAYRVFLITFLLIFGPFVFFNVQKTKYIQLFTTLTRWLAFTVMIYLTVSRLLDPSVPHSSPHPAVVSGFPSLLSSCVYAFMCHHSLPSLLSPIRNKENLHRNLAADYLLVLMFYLTLAVPAVFAFPHINDLFTLNFVPQPGDSEELQIADYFLILFPVFTLTASFPVISVTLRNNLQSVVSPSRSKLLRLVILPLAAVVPPVLLAVFLPNLQFLVGITGAYAGVGIQYVIPATLVMSSRRSVPRELSSVENTFASPFRHPAWPLLVILWAIICISFSSVHIIKQHLGS